MTVGTYTLIRLYFSHAEMFFPVSSRSKTAMGKVTEVRWFNEGGVCILYCSQSAEWFYASLKE